MRKSIYIVLGLVATSLLLYFVYTTQPGGTYQSAEDQSVERTEPATIQSSGTESTTPEAPTQAGQYIAYDEDKIANTSGTQVLFFHAAWCSQCRQIENDINNEGVPENVTIYKVDYDKNQQLRLKYGVTLQTTFVVIDANGNAIKKHVAYNEPTFVAVKQAIL